MDAVPINLVKAPLQYADVFAELKRHVVDGSLSMRITRFSYILFLSKDLKMAMRVSKSGFSIVAM